MKRVKVPCPYVQGHNKQICRHNLHTIHLILNVKQGSLIWIPIL